MNKNLLILGAGQYGAAAKEVSASMGCFDKIDFLDDSFENNVTDCIPALVSPRAYVSPSAQLHEGCIVESLAGINVVVGAGSSVSIGATINHNSTVMDFCHIDCGAILLSGAVVGTGVKVEAGKIIEKMFENRLQK